MFRLNAAVVIRTKIKKFEQTHRHVEVNSCLVSQLRTLASLVLRPSPPPVFDHLQYTKTITNWRWEMPGNEASSGSSSKGP